MYDIHVTVDKTSGVWCKTLKTAVCKVLISDSMYLHIVFLNSVIIRNGYVSAYLGFPSTLGFIHFAV